MKRDDEVNKQRAKKLADFDPEENGLRHKGIFGLPFSPEESELVLIPVPWDATVSYGEGTLKGPETILQASYQIDLHDERAPQAWQYGFAMTDIPESWIDLSREYRAKAKYNIDHLEGKYEVPEQVREVVYKEVNEVCETMNAWVKEETEKWLDEGKMVGVIGGEHSVPLGFLQTLDERHDAFAVLQIDAHLDLREAYQGFTFSHASVMYNALQQTSVDRIVPVGIRDFSEKEKQTADENNHRIHCFTDNFLKTCLFKGESWDDVCNRILETLPDKVYISLDIDGLEPSLCPHTGTPVPGGLSFEQCAYLIRKIVESGKTIIGFDLCEVAPGKSNQEHSNEWDGNVGARILYRLCCDTVWSNGLK